MGFYIDGPGKGKAAFLVREHGAMVLPSILAARQAFGEGMGVVCVVDNVYFEAAGFAFLKDELEIFAEPDGRPKTWLAMDRDEAERLSGYGGDGDE